MRRRLVVALPATALSERGWPTLAEDPDSAAERAARSLSYVATDHSMLVVHDLSEHTRALLAKHLEGLFGHPVPSLVEVDAGRAGGLLVDPGVVLCATAGAATDEVAGDLAVHLDARMLVLLSDAPVVWDGAADSDSSSAVRRASPRSLPSIDADDALVPMLDVAVRFVATTDRAAAVGAIDHLEAMVLGEGGTLIRDDDAPVTFYGEEARSA